MCQYETMNLYNYKTVKRQTPAAVPVHKDTIFPYEILIKIFSSIALPSIWKIKQLSKIWYNDNIIREIFFHDIVTNYHNIKNPSAMIDVTYNTIIEIESGTVCNESTINDMANIVHSNEYLTPIYSYKAKKVKKIYNYLDEKNYYRKKNICSSLLRDTLCRNVLLLLLLTVISLITTSIYLNIEFNSNKIKYVENYLNNNTLFFPPIRHNINRIIGTRKTSTYHYHEGRLAGDMELFKHNMYLKFLDDGIDDINIHDIIDYDIVTYHNNQKLNNSKISLIKINNDYYVSEYTSYIYYNFDILWYEISMIQFDINYNTIRPNSNKIVSKIAIAIAIIIICLVSFYLIFQVLVYNYAQRGFSFYV